MQGATDSRWNDSDLVNLAGIPSSDFTVVQMTPAYPGYDSVTAPTGNRANDQQLYRFGIQRIVRDPVTFNFSVSGDSYDYIDMIGPVRLEDRQRQRNHQPHGNPNLYVVLGESVRKQRSRRRVWHSP